MNWLKNILGIRTEAAYPPSDSPPEPAATLLEAERMAGELEDYLRGDPLYRQISLEILSVSSQYLGVRAGLAPAQAGNRKGLPLLFEILLS